MRLVVTMPIAIVGALSASVSPAQGSAKQAIGQIRAVQVSGSSLGEAALSKAFAGQLGQPDTESARQAIIEAIAAAYAKSDIALYDVSLSSTADGGVVGVSTMEGYVDRAVIRGAVSGAAKRTITRYIRRIIAERPLHTSTLQRYVSLIRDIPGLHSKIEFAPTDQRDKVQIVVTVSPSNARLSASIDNRGIALTGRTEFQLSASLYGTIIGGDEIGTALFTTTSPSRLFALSGTYSMPVGADGARASLSMVRSRSALAEYGYTSSTTQFGVDISKPIARNYRQSLYVGLAAWRFRTHLGLAGYDLLAEDGVALGPKASYDGVLDGNSELAVSITSAFGWADQSSSFVRLSRVRHVRRLTLRAVTYRKLSSRLILRLKGVAQIATRNLPATERFSLGGSDFGRALGNGFLSGDAGYAASIELAWRLGSTKPLDHPSEAYVFLDGGQVSYHDPLFSTGDREQLASAGAGMRIGGKKASFSIEAATGSARTFGLKKDYRRLSIGLQRTFL